jgi:predicted nucleic acid-binding protein
MKELGEGSNARSRMAKRVGVRWSEREGAVPRDLERALPELKIDEDVWAASFDLARRARSKGITVPATDILIVACALHHGAEIETSDSDFDALNSLRTTP